MKHRPFDINLTPHCHIWAVAPNYGLAKQFWRDLKARFNPNWDPVFNEQAKSLTAAGGAILWEIKSADNPESLVGSGIDVLICIESALIVDDAWEMALQPRLMSPGRLGMAIMNGTPKGRGNWFEEFFLKGQKGSDTYNTDYWSDQAPSWINPHLDQKEIDKAREGMPTRAFQQEIEAVFLDSSGSVFSHIEECVGPRRPDGDWRLPIMIGIDWGRKNDFTVATAIDRTWRVLDQIRTNAVEFDDQIAVLKNFVGRFNPSVILVETNSLGDPLHQMLRKALGRPVAEFYTHNKNKERIIRELEMAMESETIQYPNLPILKNELKTFDFSIKSNSRNTVYGSRYHDDCVMSLALALHAHGGVRIDAPRAKSYSKRSGFRTRSPISQSKGY